MTWFPECKSSLLRNSNIKLNMLVDGGHRQKPMDFQRRHFQNGYLVAILVFWFPDSNFSLALNINSKLEWHNTYVYG